MAEYRINDLAEASGVSVRNIRVYQDRGLLPPPTIRGRTGWYSEEHLVRLNLVTRMLARGYTFGTISELLHAAHHGMKVEHVLRGTPKAGRFRNFKRAATITITELRKTLNASDRSIALSQKLGLLAKDGAHYAIRNPELLEGAEALVKSGIDIDALLDRWVRVQGDLEDVAASFVSIITDKYFDENLPDLGEKEMGRMADLIQKVRPMAHEIVETTFGKALDEQISKAIGEASKYFDAPVPDRIVAGDRDVESTETVEFGPADIAPAPNETDDDLADGELTDEDQADEDRVESRNEGVGTTTVETSTIDVGISKTFDASNTDTGTS